MPNEIEKPSHDDVLAAITSFNDPTIITNMFRELGWSYSVEIKETLVLAKQNANLSIKFKAIKHLRELLREAAETAGYTAQVSQTMPNVQGGHTTFHAKRITNILNPTKQIESSIKETQNDKKEIQPEPNRDRDRGQSQTQESVDEQSRPGEPADSTASIRDTGRAFPTGDTGSGGTEPQDGGETPRDMARRTDQQTESSEDGNPCIQTRPPTCDRSLFPGVASAED